MVDKDRVVSNETILEATGMGSILPGPMAVNVVTYIGFVLKGTKGALVSMVAILLPAVSLMLGLSWMYYSTGFVRQTGQLMTHVNTVVIAIIFSAATRLYTNAHVAGVWKHVLVIAGLCAGAFSTSFYQIAGLLVVGGCCGYLFDRAQGAALPSASRRPLLSARSWVGLLVLLLLLLLFVSGAYSTIHWLPAQIFFTFSGISLSLFGGGYVMIPIMQRIFVDGMQWISQQEFSDAIAFSQVTPGPVLVSATFIGYKLYGVPGALIATVGIFAPAATLMLLVSRVYAGIRERAGIRKLVAGIQYVVIGLIAGSAIRLGWSLPWDFSLVMVLGVALILTWYYKISPVYLMAGVVLYSLAADVFY